MQSYSKGIAVLTTFGSTLPRVGRLIQLQQVIINTAGQQLKSLGVLSFFVNGPGIASANLDRL